MPIWHLRSYQFKLHVQVKLVLNNLKHNSMKTRGEWMYSSITLALGTRRRGVVSFLSQPFYTWARAPGTQSQKWCGSFGNQQNLLHLRLPDAALAEWLWHARLWSSGRFGGGGTARALAPTNYPPKSKLDYTDLSWNVIRGNVNEHLHHFTAVCETFFEVERWIWWAKNLNGNSN
jgi:hypothetical protein